MKYDVVVIGSGLGGLECAYILSRAGLRVLVLDKAGSRGCLQSYGDGDWLTIQVSIMWEDWTKDNRCIPFSLTWD